MNESMELPPPEKISPYAQNLINAGLLPPEYRPGILTELREVWGNSQTEYQHNFPFFDPGDMEVLKADPELEEFRQSGLNFVAELRKKYKPDKNKQDSHHLI